MKFLQTIKRLTKRVALSASAVVVAGGMLAGIPLSKVSAEYYPARQAFDYNKPCDPNDSDIYDSCGSLTGPVFDSFINTPTYGDERAFVDARRTDQTALGAYKNVLPEVNKGSKEVIIRVYVHNNANQGTNASGLGIAHNTKVRVALPTGTGQVERARGYISADNAALVEDTVDFTGTQDFNVEYVPGSAKLYDNNGFKNGVTLNDSIVTNGALIGSDALDGNFKGCFDFKAVVEIHVKINVGQVQFKKQVNLADKDGWVDEVNAKPGQRIKWLITFSDTGDTDLTNVNISDQLPAHLTVVPGSVKWIYTDANNQDINAVQSDTQLFTTGGEDFQTWHPGGGFFLRFETVTKGDFDTCQIRLRNVAFNMTTETGKTNDTADVVVTKENCVPPTPTELPNTGPGDILGIFAAVSIGAGLAHKFVWARGRKF